MLTEAGGVEAAPLQVMQSDFLIYDHKYLAGNDPVTVGVASDACVLVCVCVFVLWLKPACCDSSEGLLQCQERGGFADGEHYIIAAMGVIEGAAERGGCIQAECWVCLSATTRSFKCVMTA